MTRCWLHRRACSIAHEPPTPLEAGATVPPDFAHEAGEQASSAVDAEVIAGRLQENDSRIFWRAMDAASSKRAAAAPCRSTRPGSSIRSHAKWCPRSRTK